MSGRTLLVLWAVSLCILGASAALFTQPGYTDAYYYYHVAANLAAGRGLVEEFIWNYLAPVGGIPHPSNLYWMPLTSLVSAPVMAFFGSSFRAAQAPLVIIASLSPVAVTLVVWDLWRDRWLALASAMLTLFGGFYFLYWTVIDSFGLFALAVTVGLWAQARYLWQSQSEAGHMPSTTRFLPWLLGLVAGLTTAAAHLARADGFLLLLVALAIFLLLRSPGWAWACLAAVVGYILVMGPWFWRMWSLTGELAAPGAMTTLFLQEYNDLFSYNQDHTLASYLAWGLGPILLSKLKALGENLVVLYGAGLMLLPIGLVGAWRLRRDRRLLPFFVYAALLYLLLTLVFTFPGARGSMRHSGVALLPWTAVLAVQGIRVTVSWAAQRLPHWNVQRAQIGFTLVAMSASIALSLVILLYNAKVWDQEYDYYQAVAQWLDDQGGVNAPIMVTDPPAFYYASGRGAVVTPSNGIDAMIAVADRYRVDYIALEAAHAASLHPLYLGDESSPRLEPLEWIGATHMFRVLR